MQNRLLHRPVVIQKAFLFLFFSILIALNIAVGVYLVQWRNLISLFQFSILQVINIGVAYGLAELVLSLVVPHRDLSNLEQLTRRPAVAILYATCDDVIPDVLARLNDQAYSNYDVFVLDDSSQPEWKAKVDASDFAVIRRESRKGFKAGNLNHWLSKFGSDYEYFVVVDSDSLLPPDFLEHMLRYAEHPANADVAVFQSKIMIWNLDCDFARTIAAWFPMWLYPTEKLGNLCDTMLSWGHNCLYRTQVMSSIGGFDERFTAEDYATGAALLRVGYRCRLVDVISYEAMPPSHQTYARRAVRWAKQTLQLFHLDMAGLPTTTKLHVLANGWSFAISTLYVPGMLLAIWGSRSTLRDLADFVRLLVSGEFIHTSLLLPLLIIAFYNMYFLILRYPLCRKLGIGTREYWRTLILLLALGPYMALPLAVSQLRTFASSAQPTFTVTKKVDESTNIWGDLLDMWHVFLLVAIVLIGVLRNPISMIFNASWLIPLIVSPLVLLSVHGHHKAKTRSVREPPLTLYPLGEVE